MIDLTGRKHRIQELEAEIARQDGTIQHAAMELKTHLVENRKLKNQIEYLVRTIRQMDDIIFSMGQAADGSWKSVQSRFTQLHDQMTARKVGESNRINDILRPQLIETYKPDTTAPKQIGSK